MGVVQGLTEFLPVSSSGHLALARRLLHAGLAQDLGMEIAVHAGTLVACLIYYRVRILKIFTQTLRNEEEGRKWLLWLVIATIPAGVAGLLLKDKVPGMFNSMTRIGVGFLITAAILFFSERVVVGRIAAGDMGFWRALVIGIGQAVAIEPSISRSGTTISAALFTGVEKRSATDFAFILSLPSVGGATLLIVKEWVEGNAAFGIPHIVGALAAGVLGYLTIGFMIRVVAGGKLRWFALYCVAVGIVSFAL
jgi:undecaprenyl-diphosphatase